MWPTPWHDFGLSECTSIFSQIRLKQVVMCIILQPFIQIQPPKIMPVMVASRWIATNPWSPCPSFMTGNRISSPICFNDHFVASMSQSFKLSLLEEQAWMYLVASNPRRLSGRGDRRHSRASHLSRQDEADQMVTWMVLYARPSLSRQSKNTSILINANTKNQGWLQRDVGQPTPWLYRPAFRTFVPVKIHLCLPGWWQRSANGGSTRWTRLGMTQDEGRWTLE